MALTKLITTLIIAVLLAITASAFLDGTSASVELKCKDQVIKNAQKCQIHMKECIDEFTALHENKMAGEKKRGATCIHLCALKKDGFFDATGVYQEKAFNDTIETMLEVTQAKAFKDGSHTCAQTNNITSITDDKNDFTCSGYKKFFQCLSHVFIGTCTNMNPAIWNED